MKKVFRFLGIAVVAAVIVFSTASCDMGNGNDDDKGGGGGNLVNGTNEAWIAGDNGWGYIFHSDGSFDEIYEEFPDYWEMDEDLEGSYSTDGDTLTMSFHYPEYEGDDYTDTYTYSVSGNTLKYTYSEAYYTSTWTFTRRNIKIGVFTPPANHTPLTQNQWVNGNITNDRGLIYSFNVTAGTEYTIWGNSKDSGSGYSGDGSKTLPDVDAVVIHSNGTMIFDAGFFYWDYSYISNDHAFTAAEDGTVYVWIHPYDVGDTGTFGLVYSTGNTRPSL